MNNKANYQKKIEKNNNESTYIKHMIFLPIVLMLAIVPLIVRLNIIPLDPSIGIFWTSKIETDIYCFSKSVMIISLAVVMFISLFFMVNKYNLKIDRITKIIYASVGLFLVMSILSSVASEYKHVALWGAPERHEGLVMHMCYITMFLYTYFIMRSSEDFKYIKYALIFLSLIMIIIGVSQVINKDILTSDFIYNLTTPDKYKDIVKPVSTNGLVYLTLMNPNYVGSYASLIIPFFSVIALSNHENKILRTIMGVIVVATSLILVKANSQAGLVGVSLGILAVIAINFKIIFKSRKLLIGTIVFAVAATGIANTVSQGLLIHNTVDIILDAKTLFANKDSYVYDPTYGLPVYDVKTDGNEARIETVDGQLNLDFKDDATIVIKDSKGNLVENKYNSEEKNYTLTAPYDKMKILKSSQSNSSYAQIALYYNEFTYYLLEWVKGDGIYLIDAQANRFELEVAPHIGFEGSEKVGSMRGYIWSRTLPLIAKKPLLGYGPDNFLMAFPQYDIVAKTYAYDTPFMIVDKPHNIYLLYAVNSGIIALGAMLVLWGVYIIKSFKLYALRKEYTKGEYYGIACTVAITGYLAAGFFNDSVPVVAPIFWVLLGAGYALNYINSRDRMSVLSVKSCKGL